MEVPLDACGSWGERGFVASGSRPYFLVGKDYASTQNRRVAAVDEYSEWLFKILYDVEENMDKETYIHDSYRKRMFGFLSERLLNVWVIYNKDKLNIKEFYLINTQEKFIQKFKYYIKQVILKIMKKNK